MMRSTSKVWRRARWIMLPLYWRRSGWLGSKRIARSGRPVFWLRGRPPMLRIAPTPRPSTSKTRSRGRWPEREEGAKIMKTRTRSAPMKRPPTPFELKKSVSGKGNNQNAAPPRRCHLALDDADRAREHVHGLREVRVHLHEVR